MTQPYIICCIPARHASTRLPGKCILELEGQPIIKHVWDRVNKCKMINEIIILTDHSRISNVVKSFNGNVSIINEECRNGTERIIHYLKKKNISCKNTIIVNVQGDEPYIDPTTIDNCIQNYIKSRVNDNKIVCSTAYYNTNDEEIIKSVNKGKLVLDENNKIIYCSRTPIPVLKNGKINNKLTYKIHIGIFVFDINYLLNNYLGNNTPAQLSEDIEWLKIIEQGYKIISCESKYTLRSVDTLEDYNYLKNKTK